MNPSPIQRKPHVISLSQRLRNGETLLSTMVTLGSPETVEILAMTGFDWLFLDGEHAPLEPAEIKTIRDPVFRFQTPWLPQHLRPLEFRPNRRQTNRAGTG